MKQRKYLYLCMTCLFLAFLITMTGNRQGEEALASRIAPEILRFHVLANSNSSRDQQIKLNVRTLLLDSIYEGLGDDATLDETKTYIIDNRFTLENEAENYMSGQGYSYPAHIEITDCHFPTKTYGDMVFPHGTYEAVRVEIGQARGRNWWCVLYPPLCFTDSTYAVVPDASKSILEQSLNAEDYLALKKDPKVKVNLRLRLPKLVREVLGIS